MPDPGRSRCQFHWDSVHVLIAFMVSCQLFTFSKFSILHIRMLLSPLLPFFVPFLLSVVQSHLEDSALPISQITSTYHNICSETESSSVSEELHRPLRQPEFGDQSSNEPTTGLFPQQEESSNS